MSLENTSTTSTCATPPTKKIIYFVRHAEATHNVLEHEAVERVKAAGTSCKKLQDEARRSVLHCPTLKDAPLSKRGVAQSKSSWDKLSELVEHENSPFAPPQIVLVSPLRRALMTATTLFGNIDPPPKFIAIEALREKRTGMECDERHDPTILQHEFPHVDFTNVQQGLPVVSKGEDNTRVRARVKNYLEQHLPHVPHDFVAIVSHKGWLRELRHTLKGYENAGDLHVDFDLNEWHQTLYGNAELRVASFEWTSSTSNSNTTTTEGGEEQETPQLSCVIERSVDNVMSDIVASSSGTTTNNDTHQNPFVSIWGEMVSLWEKLVVPTSHETLVPIQ